MFDNDWMTNSAELRELRESMSGVAMPEPPRLEEITGRHRMRRHHRLSAAGGLSVVAIVGAVLALGLAGVFGSGSGAQAPGTIRTVSYTLVHHTDGTVTLTINPNELLDTAALQSDLAQYGIPAVVTSGRFCSSDPHPAGFSQVVAFSPAGGGTWTPQSGAQPTITIDPSAMPAGAELSVGDFQLTSGDFAGQQQAEMVLIDSSSYTCTSTPPDPNSPPPGYGQSDSFGLLYGGPGSSGS